MPSWPRRSCHCARDRSGPTTDAGTALRKRRSTRRCLYAAIPNGAKSIPRAMARTTAARALHRRIGMSKFLLQRRTGSDLGQRQEPASLCGSRVPAGLRPYDQVQPLVQRVLQRTKPVTASANSWQLQNLPAPWSRVLLSRRPDLRAAIADHATLPKLQQALQQGAITRQELDWRMDQARARVDRLFQAGRACAAVHRILGSPYHTTASPVSTEARYSSGAGRQRDIRASGDGRSVRSHRLPAQPRLQPVESPDTSGPGHIQRQPDPIQQDRHLRRTGRRVHGIVRRAVRTGDQAGNRRVAHCMAMPSTPSTPPQSSWSRRTRASRSSSRRSSAGTSS